MHASYIHGRYSKTENISQQCCMVKGKDTEKSKELVPHEGDHKLDSIPASRETGAVQNENWKAF